MIRAPRPTDLLPLLAFSRRAVANEARPGERLSNGANIPLPLGTFFQEWLSLDENRYSWLALQGREIVGLVSVRNRAHQSVWELDRIFLTSHQDPEETCQALLEYLGAVGGEIGIEKVFLRLEQGSPLVPAAHQAGFAPYAEETLYRVPAAQSAPASGVAPPPGLRHRQRHDDQALFRLYNIAIPGEVRRAEALTLREWLAIQPASTRGGREWVLESDGQLVAWLRVTRMVRCGWFELLVHPDYQDLVEALVPFCLVQLGPRRIALILVPQFKTRLAWAVQEQGGEEAGLYTALVRRLTVRVRMPRLMPVRA